MTDLFERIASLTPEKRAILRQRNPLSYAQQRMWFMDQLAPTGRGYNIPSAMRLRGRLDIDALERSLQEIVGRHEVLRAGFPAFEGEPLQVVSPNAEIDLPVTDLSGVPEDSRQNEIRRLELQEVQRPFDLARGPLLRGKLLRLSEDDHVLLLTMHHIVSDGWSLGILNHELTVLYEAFCSGKPSPLPELPIQYADFARWQREHLQGDLLEGQLRYWKQQLRGQLPVLELPTDHPRPPVQAFRGATEKTTLPVELADKLNALSQREGVTFFMTLLAAFKVLLRRYTGEEDVVVGSPIANRNRTEIEGLIGFFVNMLVMRTDLSGNPSFTDVLRRVREMALGAYEHQDLPFEKLVDELESERDMSRNPLFQVSFALQNTPMAPLELPGLTVTVEEVEARATRFDLELYVCEEAEGLSCIFCYSTDLFERATIQRLLGHWKALLAGILADPECPISDLPILSDSELHRILVEWNNTEADYPKDTCIHHLFEGQAERIPDAVAVRFCPQDTEQGSTKQLTYSELNRRSNQLASYLQKLGVRPEVLVAVCLERSVDMIVAILGILKAGAAYVPLDPRYPKQRLAYMLDDSKAAVLITRDKLAATLPEHRARLVRLDQDREQIDHEPQENLETSASASSLAYVIYTSGSTGQPKGTLLEHGPVCNLTTWQRRFFGLSRSDRVLQFSTISFDAFVWEVCMAFGAGAALHLAPWETLASPEDLARLLCNESITAAILPVTMLKALPEQDFPTLKALMSAGEACPAEIVERWAPGRRFYNAYGPTETTVCASAHLCEAHYAKSPPIGRPIANTTLYVLDQGLHPVPVGVAGELHIGGVGLARGYLNRGELTAERFVPNPFGEESGERLYKTGDLVRYLPDGNLEFLGRIDHQVKIRGIRIELGEIEAVLGRHPAVQKAVVLAREDNPGDQFLAAYVVGDEDTSSGRDLRSYLKAKLPDYMVPAAFVFLEVFPLTPSGKVDRRALQAPVRTRTDLADTYVAPRSPIERTVAAVWAEVLGLEKVGVNDNFFDLGGHSLSASQMVARVRAVLDVDLPLRAVFEDPTVAGLVMWIDASDVSSNAAPPIVPVPRDMDLPLSFAQQRLWFIDQLAPGNPGYNMPAAFRLSGRLNVLALEAGLSEIIRRHELLRTTIKSVNGKPTQVISPPEKFELPVVDLGERRVDDRETEVDRLAAEEALRPFDLSRDGVLRAVLLRLEGEKHVLLLTMHHIVADGWSVGVFLRELTALYEAFCTRKPSPLPELPVQYADFAVWQRQWLRGHVLDTQLSYWKKRLTDLPVLDLPADHPRPSVQCFKGAAERLLVAKELSADLKALSQRESVTLFMTLLAAFKVLLHRYTNQEDIAVGSPIANRNRAEIEGLIGFFVNMLVMRTDLSGSPSFTEVLRRVRETALGAYEHQDLPFERLVDELQPERDMSRNPLFQVGFVLQNAPMAPLELPGLTVTLEETEARTTRFDLEFHIWEKPEGLSCVLCYSTDLFEPETIQRLLGHWEMLLEGVVASPERPISDLPILSDSERHQLLVEWNDTRQECPADRCVHNHIESRADRHPAALAVAQNDRQLSYGELNARANRLAHRLLKLGVGPDAVVAVCMERSPETIAALLGILKAGGAYLPLDPGHPSSRVKFMLEDSGARLVLTQHDVAQRLPLDRVETICLEPDWREVRDEPSANPDSRVAPSSLAYVIYTSGSTGRPKGVEVEHSGLLNLVFWHLTAFSVACADRATQLAGTAFDASVWEIWPYLVAGASLHLPDEEVRVSAELLRDWLVSEEITISFLPTPLAEGVIGLDWPMHVALRTLLTGGDRLRSYPPHSLPFTLVNNYGPTENSVVTTSCVVAPDGHTDAAPPIGRPIGNNQVYILDKHGEPMPIGLPGEIYIGGHSLARGYLNRPELTAERFVPNPFSDQAGARLYRTGDLGRYLPDGQIEFRGRVDRQVKIRGVRIELGEVEAVLCQHPAVLEAVALAPEDKLGDRQLVAYVVPDTACCANENPEEQITHVSHWQALHDGIYAQGCPVSDPSLNVVGWYSSYTGEPIPPEQMREWVEHTTDRIVLLRPRRILEIGCGTGMLLFRIAPHCECYEGWDFSTTALSHIRTVMGSGMALSGVRLSERLADDFTGVEPDSFDAVIMNSVVQYFPSVDYLLRVLTGAVEAVAPGGFIYLGDVRSLPLLEAYAASVQLHQADDNLSREELRQRVHRQVMQEEELVLHPELFHALKGQFPKIRRVEIEPKRGRHHNELTRFRYEVLLHIGKEADTAAEIEWKDWDQNRLDLASVRVLLGQPRPDAVGLRRVPNARLSTERQMLAWLASDDGPDTVGAFRSSLDSGGIEPDALRALADELGHGVALDWSRPGDAGSFDVIFSPDSLAIEDGSGRNPIAPRSWETYANNPLQGAFARKLAPRLRTYLRDRFPEPMVPSAVVLLDALPLTANGKVDRRTLSAPGWLRPESTGAYLAPQTALEGRLAAIWREVLGVERVGLHDNFFDLGGHSLLGIQLLARIDATFEVQLPIRALFDAPTVTTMAEYVEKAQAKTGPTSDVHAVEHNAESSVVPIQPRGSNRPFFCVAPASGVVYPYYHLATLLGPEQPFYGIEDPRLGTRQVHITEVEDLAKCHIEGLREVQGQGPYLLGGWSFGGLVVFEMARQLTELGEKIALLAIFECGAVNGGDVKSRALTSAVAKLPRALATVLSSARDSLPYICDGLYLLASRARARPGHSEEHLSVRDYVRWRVADTVYRYMLTKAEVARVLSKDTRLALMELPAARRVFATLGANLREQKLYSPRTYPGRITLFHTGSDLTQTAKDQDSTLGWAAYATHGVEVHTVPGNHAAIFAPPYVQVLAERLKTCIEMAQH